MRSNRVLSCTNTNAVSQTKLGISREWKRTRPEEEFSYKIVVSQLLLTARISKSFDLDFSCSFFCVEKLPSPLPYFVLLQVCGVST